jgi:transposase
LIEPCCLGKRGDPRQIEGTVLSSSKRVLWIACTGSSWRDIPAEFRHWNSVFKRFRRWVQRGAFERIFKLLSADADFEYVMVDGALVRVPRHGQGRHKKGTENQSIGKSRGGLTAKMLALADALGNLVRLRWRHLIENFFQGFKEFRGIAMRSCKTDSSLAVMIYLAAVPRTR